MSNERPVVEAVARGRQPLPTASCQARLGPSREKKGYPQRTGPGTRWVTSAEPRPTVERVPRPPRRSASDHQHRIPWLQKAQQRNSRPGGSNHARGPGHPTWPGRACWLHAVRLASPPHSRANQQFLARQVRQQSPAPSSLTRPRGFNTRRTRPAIRPIRDSTPPASGQGYGGVLATRSHHKIVSAHADDQRWPACLSGPTPPASRGSTAWSTRSR